MDSAWEAHLASTLASVYTCVGIHTHMSTHDAHHTHMFTRKIKLQRSSWIISLTVTHNLSYTPISFPMEEPNHDPSTNAGTGPRMRVSAVWQWRGLLKHLINLAKPALAAETFILLSSLNYSIPSKIHRSSTAVPWPLETVGDLFGRWKCFTCSCLPIWKIIICALFI